ncbi:hypothetical protein [Aeromicrobium sp. 9AM]|uniref:hypothetical protein n=1 Tax=Aeromicrobium sp. 9AM TaxID=2653126 RepID=UPI0012F04558|nr:hypothetical protein [Aeromicrobium sp. 9AM]VXC06823.1 conserved hypothetical protein [Aeromicrobium sp. 9AM]
MSGVKTDYTREDLIAICEKAIVPESDWSDRDSQRSQVKIGQAWALLKAGCDWHLADDPETDARTIWIEIYSQGFNWFEGGYDGRDDEFLTRDLFYLPTPGRLIKADGKDWY